MVAIAEKQVSASWAKAHFSEMLDEVGTSLVAYRITRYNKVAATLASPTSQAKGGARLMGVFSDLASVADPEQEKTAWEQAAVKKHADLA